MADDLAVVPCAERSGSEHDSLSDCHCDEHEALVEDHEGDAGPEDATEPAALINEAFCKSYTPGTLMTMGGKFFAGKDSLIHVTFRCGGEEITASYKTVFEIPVNNKGFNLLSYTLVRIDLYDQ